MPRATLLWAGLLALLYLALSVRVVGHRRRARIALGHGTDRLLERAVRTHANFAEYAPFALLLMLVAELGGAWAPLLHLAGLALLAGRAVHAWGVAREPEDLRLRPVGMGLTFAALLLLALTCLVLVLR